MLSPGDRLICAVSGGADSMALLWGMYLLKDKLKIELAAAHFNHHLRGAESDRDEAFVKEFCQRYDIPLYLGGAQVLSGKKGLEAAAREARYGFLDGLEGKVATAHTADDNAETVLMHLVRGTGLKGLGGIAPINGNRIRPMLTVTRRQVLAFLEEYHISHIEDSSNECDAYLRNRMRHHVMPLLRSENPKLVENLSAMAMRLRQDAQELEILADYAQLPEVSVLRNMTPSQRSRVLERFLKKSGVKEPEAEHIALAEGLIFSQKPSARANFPGGVILRRNYDRLEGCTEACSLVQLSVPQTGIVELPEIGLRLHCDAADGIVNTGNIFTFCPAGNLVVRHRLAGDEIRLNAGTKSLKKLFIDRKIPAQQRLRIPVLADDLGVIGVYGIGIHLDRIPEQLPAVQIRFEAIHSSEEL